MTTVIFRLRCGKLCKFRVSVVLLLKGKYSENTWVPCSSGIFKENQILEISNFKHSSLKRFSKKVPIITRELLKDILCLADSTLFLNEALYP